MLATTGSTMARGCGYNQRMMFLLKRFSQNLFFCFASSRWHTASMRSELSMLNGFSRASTSGRDLRYEGSLQGVLRSRIVHLHRSPFVSFATLSSSPLANLTDISSVYRQKMRPGLTIPAPTDTREYQRLQGTIVLQKNPKPSATRGRRRP